MLPLRSLLTLATLWAFLSGCSSRLVEPTPPDTVGERVVVMGEEVAAGHNLFPVEIDGLWGYIDREGRVVIEPQFSQAFAFAEGRARVVFRGRYGFIDPSGGVVIEPRFLRASDFSGGRARVVLPDAGVRQFAKEATDSGRRLEAFVDPGGAVVVPSVLAEARDFGGADDFSLAPVVRVQTQDYYPLGVDLFGLFRWRRQEAGDWEVLRDDGTLAFQVAGSVNMLGYAEGLFPVAMKGTGWRFASERWGYLDGAGALVIEPRFQMAYGFSEGRAAVVIDERVGYIDTSGTLVVPPDFEFGGAFQEGRAAVRRDGLWGFIDRTGALVVTPQYDWATEFSSGRALVQQGERFGFLSADGAAALPIQYDYARPFRQGLAYVRTGNREGYIDPGGAFVWSRTVSDTGL